PQAPVIYRLSYTSLFRSVSARRVICARIRRGLSQIGGADGEESHQYTTFWQCHAAVPGRHEDDRVARHLDTLTIRLDHGAMRSIDRKSTRLNSSHVKISY